MNKLLSCFLCLILVSAVFVGCTSDNSSSKDISETSHYQNIENESVDEEGTVVVCCETGTEDMVLNLGAYLNRYCGVKTKYVTEVIPAEPEERTNTLKRIKAEIMAGKGPDLFIMNSYNETISGYIDSYTADFLFESPENVMASYNFLDITEMVEKSKVIELDKCVQPIMDAGMLDGCRYILPIYYTYTAVMSSNDILRDKDFSYSTIDDIINSGERELMESMSFLMRSRPYNLLADYADYESGTFNLQVEDVEWIRDSKAAIDNRLKQVEGNGYHEPSSVYRDVCVMQIGFICDTEPVVYPMPNKDGGVTAVITHYGAINANTDKPNAAFALLEMLLHDAVQTQGSIEVGFERSYVGQLQDAWDYGIPVKHSVMEKMYDESTIKFTGASPGDIDMSKTIESLNRNAEKINSVKFYSNLDKALKQGIFKSEPEETYKAVRTRFEE